MTRAKDVSKITTDANFSGTLDVTGATTLSNNLSVDGGTIKLDGNYPTGSNNVALGNASLDSLTTGNNNTAIGNSALTANTEGLSNTAIGEGSLDSNTTASNNTAVGRLTLEANTTGATNTAVGGFALRENTTASNNTAVGYSSLYSNTTGSQLTALGRLALYANTTGVYNIAIGSDAMFTNTTGGYNASIGTYSMYSNSTGNSNNALGYFSLYSNTTASGNVAVGHEAMRLNTSGASNIGLGYQALRSNTTASNNTAVGYQSLYSTTTAGQNTTIGYRAGFSNTTGAYNVFLGYEAGNDGTQSARNTFVGYRAGENITTGICNVFVGGTDTSQNGSGSLITTGSKHSILGSFDGNQGGLDIRTASNHIVLSDGDGNPRGIFDNSGNFLVGKASTDITVEGVVIKPTDTGGGMLFATSSGERVAILNRNTSDGSILEFRKDNTVVGSIGSASGDLHIGTGDAGLRFYDAGPAIYPRDTSGNDEDGTVDLGLSSARFKDLYLSGGVYLGGTGSANKLDDYEEGTWTPTYTSTGASFSYNNQFGYYTKIGSFVHAQFYLLASISGTTSNLVNVTNLPFVSANLSSVAESAGSVWFSGTDNITPLINNNSSIIIFYKNGSTSVLLGADMNNKYLVGSVFYRAS